MSEIDPDYYYKYTSKSDPHFCTVCQTWRDDKSLLGSQNYSAWVNYGMCQKCLRHYLGFQNGLIVTQQRKIALVTKLLDDQKLRNSINVHLRYMLFPDLKSEEE